MYVIWWINKYVVIIYLLLWCVLTPDVCLYFLAWNSGVWSTSQYGIGRGRGNCHNTRSRWRDRGRNREKGHSDSGNVVCARRCSGAGVTSVENYMRGLEYGFLVSFHLFNRAICLARGIIYDEFKLQCSLWHESSGKSNSSFIDSWAQLPFDMHWLRVGYNHSTHRNAEVDACRRLLSF